MPLSSSPSNKYYVTCFVQCSLSLVACATVWFSMKEIIMDPLKATAAEMAHMDPSEIIAVPFPLEGLRTLVYFTIAIVLLTAPCTRLVYLHIPTEILAHLMATASMFAVLILCGVHPLRDLQHTLWASLYLTILAWPIGVLRDGKKKSDFSFMNRFYQLVDLPLAAKGDDIALIVASHRFYGTLIGLIPCAILNILDWGVQIQRWPLPLLIGGTYGWMAGNFAGMVAIVKLVDFDETSPPAVAKKT